MGKRSTSRRLAMQALYQVEMTDASPEDALESVASDEEFIEETIRFAKDLVAGTLSNIKAIDPEIASFSKDWPMDRMSRVDKSILRLAAYEILFEKVTPGAVIADEAVELAKKYGGADSAKFINGILGSLIKKAGSMLPA